jgi:hypothetical protein
MSSYVMVEVGLPHSSDLFLTSIYRCRWHYRHHVRACQSRRLTLLNKVVGATRSSQSNLCALKRRPPRSVSIVSYGIYVHTSDTLIFIGSLAGSVFVTEACKTYLQSGHASRLHLWCQTKRPSDKLEGTEWANAENIERGVDHFDKHGKRKVNMFYSRFVCN